MMYGNLKLGFNIEEIFKNLIRRIRIKEKIKIKKRRNRRVLIF